MVRRIHLCLFCSCVRTHLCCHARMNVLYSQRLFERLTSLKHAQVLLYYMEARRPLRTEL